MLQKLNERLQGVIAWIIIVLVAVTFTLFGVEYYIQARQTATNAALEVNGRSLSKDLFNQKYERMRQSMEARHVPFDQQYKQQLINELVLNQLSLQSAEQYGFNVSPSQASAAILRIPQFLEEGKFSPLRYQQVLSSALFTHETFLREVQEGMLLNQQRFAFMGTAFALPNEVESYIKLYKQKRDYRYLTIPLQIFLKTSQASSQELQTYYQQHPSEFTAPESVSLEYVRLSMADVKSHLSISTEEEQRYYQENQNLYTDKKGQVQSFDSVKEAIHQQLLTERAQADFSHQLEELADLSYQTPDDLSAVAKQLKLKLETTPQLTQAGGETPITQNKQVIHAAFSHDVLSLGNNSAPIQFNDETVIVVRVQQHIPAKTKPFEEVKALIEKQVALQKAKEQANQLGDSLKTAKTEAERDAIMNQYHLTWQAAHNATRQDKTNKNRLAFSLPSLPGSMGGEGLETGYLLVELQKITDGSLKDMDKDQLAGITEQVEANDGSLDYELYIKQLRKEAKIVVN